MTNGYAVIKADFAGVGYESATGKYFIIITYLCTDGDEGASFHKQTPIFSSDWTPSVDWKPLINATIANQMDTEHGVNVVAVMYPDFSIFNL